LKESKLSVVACSENSNVDYKVYLKENKFYEKDYLEKDNQYIASLINKIETKFRQTIPYIKNGNWWVDNTDTGVQAQGPTGPAGANGKDGKDGVNGINGQNGYTPTIIIGANGNWYIDGVDTGKTSRGPMGPSGSGSGAMAGMGPFSDAVNYKTTNWDNSVGDCPPFEWILVTTDENSNDVTKAIWYIGQNTFIDAFGGIVQSTT
jgi:hypothetical protein